MFRLNVGYLDFCCFDFRFVFFKPPNFMEVQH